MSEELRRDGAVHDSRKTVEIGSCSALEVPQIEGPVFLLLSVHEAIVWQQEESAHSS